MEYYLNNINNIYKNDLLSECTEKDENEEDKILNNIIEEKANLKAHKKKNRRVTSKEVKDIELNEHLIPFDNINKTNIYLY